MIAFQQGIKEKKKKKEKESFPPYPPKLSFILVERASVLLAALNIALPFILYQSVQ